MGLDSAEAAENAINGIVSSWMIFCGVLVSPSSESLQRFWIWMYRLSPSFGEYLVTPEQETKSGGGCDFCPISNADAFPRG